MVIVRCPKCQKTVQAINKTFPCPGCGEILVHRIVSFGEIKMSSKRYAICPFCNTPTIPEPVSQDDYWPKCTVCDNSQRRSDLTFDMEGDMALGEITEYGLCKKCSLYIIPKPRRNSHFISCPKCGEAYSKDNITFIPKEKLTRDKVPPANWLEVVIFLASAWVVMTLVVLVLGVLPYVALWGFIVGIGFWLGRLFLSIVSIIVYSITSPYTQIGLVLSFILASVWFKNDILYYIDKYKAYRLYHKQLKELKDKNQRNYQKLKEEKVTEEEKIRPFIQDQNSLNGR